MAGPVKSYPGKPERWFFSSEKLKRLPSIRAGWTAERELQERQQTASNILEIGRKLQLTQLCMNTAIVYMHRFYLYHSFQKFPRQDIAAACLFLAGKAEECPHKLEHVVKVSYAFHQNEELLDVKSNKYLDEVQKLVFNENVLLQTLGFDLSVEHPHTHVVKCCHLVKAPKDLTHTSYYCATDSLHLTTFCLRFRPTVVACVSIHLACKWARWEIPESHEGKPWFFYVDSQVSVEILDALTAEFVEILQKEPKKLCIRRHGDQHYQQQRANHRELSANVSATASTSVNRPRPPPSSSTQGQPSSGGAAVAVANGPNSSAHQLNSESSGQAPTAKKAKMEPSSAESGDSHAAASLVAAGHHHPPGGTSDKSLIVVSGSGVLMSKIKSEPCLAQLNTLSGGNPNLPGSGHHRPLPPPPVLPVMTGEKAAHPHPPPSSTSHPEYTVKQEPGTAGGSSNRVMPGGDRQNMGASSKFATNVKLETIVEDPPAAIVSRRDPLGLQVGLGISKKEPSPLESVDGGMSSSKTGGEASQIPPPPPPPKAKSGRSGTPGSAGMTPESGVGSATKMIDLTKYKERREKELALKSEESSGDQPRKSFMPDISTSQSSWWTQDPATGGSEPGTQAQGIHKSSHHRTEKRKHRSPSSSSISDGQLTSPPSKSHRSSGATIEGKETHHHSSRHKHKKSSHKERHRHAPDQQKQHRGEPLPTELASVGDRSHATNKPASSSSASRERNPTRLPEQQSLQERSFRRSELNLAGVGSPAATASKGSYTSNSNNCESQMLGINKSSPITSSLPNRSSNGRDNIKIASRHQQGSGSGDDLSRYGIPATQAAPLAPPAPPQLQHRPHPAHLANQASDRQHSVPQSLNTHGVMQSSASRHSRQSGEGYQQRGHLVPATPNPSGARGDVLGHKLGGSSKLHQNRSTSDVHGRPNERSVNLPGGSNTSHRVNLAHSGPPQPNMGFINPPPNQNASGLPSDSFKGAMIGGDNHSMGSVHTSSAANRRAQMLQHRMSSASSANGGMRNMDGMAMNGPLPPPPPPPHIPGFGLAPPPPPPANSNFSPKFNSPYHRPPLPPAS